MSFSIVQKAKSFLKPPVADLPKNAATEKIIAELTTAI
jgi:hypothetical protein